MPEVGRRNYVIYKAGYLKTNCRRSAVAAVDCPVFMTKIVIDLATFQDIEIT